jgi:FkbM family methyltransferase
MSVVFLGPDHLRAIVPVGAPSGTGLRLGRHLAALAGSAERAAGLVVLRKLRPTKVRNAIRRRWFEWRMSRHSLRDAPGLEDLGSSPGGWTVPLGLVAPGWLCYSFGAGGDVSFDVALMQRSGVSVRSFDPVDRYVEAARREAGPGLPFSAHLVALAARDGPIQMQVTHHPNSEAMSSAGLFETSRYVQRPGRRLSTLMAELGDRRVDLLKMEIEGGEYEVVPALDLAAAGVSVMSMQLHHNGGVRRARRLIDTMRAKGYELVACRPAVKLTFVRRDLLDGAAPHGGRRRPGAHRSSAARPPLDRPRA